MKSESGWVEASGETVDEAIDAVLDLLDLDEDDAEIEVFRPAATGRSGRDGQGRVRVRARPRPETTSEAELGEEFAEEDEPEAEATDEERMEVARGFCEGLLKAFELEGEVDLWVDEEGVLRVEFLGQDLGVLIGRRGNTLQSLAEVVRTVVQRQTFGRTRLFVDVEGYRARRREALAAYALRLGRRVVEDGVEVALEPMPAGDRKVVHDAINVLAGAVTFSEGEEPRRYVVVAPDGVRASASRGRRRA